MARVRHRIAAILPIETEYSARLMDSASEYAYEHRHIELLDRSYDRSRPPDFSGKIDFAGALLFPNKEDVWLPGLIAKKDSL